MAEYYFISQLPSLDGIGENTMPPITEERFYELCRRFLGKKAQSQIELLTLLPSKFCEKSDSELINAWNDGERNLRFALAKARADKMKRELDDINPSIPIGLSKVANTAVDFESPLEAEKYLNSYRLEFLETLRPVDTFSTDYVYYYGIKLKLLLRIRSFNAQIGETAYKNIYNSISNGDMLEAIE